MSIIVEHAKRRREILDHALDVFVDEGFEAATFKKISSRCGITRTTLYIYFRNKRDIFNFSIKQFLQVLENDIMAIGEKNEPPYAEKLVSVMCVIIDRLTENRRLLSVILDYLVNSLKGDGDPFKRVRRRTLRLRHIHTKMLIVGIKAGEFSPDINVKDANEMLYSFIESAIFRLAVLHRNTVDELKDAVKLAVKQLQLKDRQGMDAGRC